MIIICFPNLKLRCHFRSSLSVQIHGPQLSLAVASTEGTQLPIHLKLSFSTSANLFAAAFSLFFSVISCFPKYA